LTCFRVGIILKRPSFYLYLSPITKIESGNSFHQHPERQHGRRAVNEVADYRATAPGFVFLAKHVRRNRNYSDKLKDAQGNGANPPPHLIAPPQWLARFFAVVCDNI